MSHRSRFWSSQTSRILAFIPMLRLAMPFNFRRLAAREKRLLVLLAVAVALAAWKFVPRPWHPAVRLQTAHYSIESTASRAHTEEVARVSEELYRAYSNRFAALPRFTNAHAPLRMKLYKDRDEFRRVNPGLGWAEAFYRHPFCRAYYSAKENNPCHWMLHEAVHQLNEEVAHVDPVKWLEEGVAEYFSTGRIVKGALKPGTIDVDTYPVWWTELIATTPDLNANLQNGSIIPLRVIVTGTGGPPMNQNVNLYYLHWWTLTHFVFEHPEHRASALKLLQAGGGIEAFERMIGPVEKVQAEWHAHVRRIRLAVEGHNPHFLRTGELP
jgi:hypothetical protein